MYRNLFILLVLNTICNHIGSTATLCELPTWFPCKNERCISPTLLCDGVNDCGDNSDEEHCIDIYRNSRISRSATIRYLECATDEYQCLDESCIPIEEFCDAVFDCADGSDEYEGCVKELKCDTFRCNDGHCVRNEWVCDGVPDCPDSSDERNCASKPVSVGECNYEFDRYLCENQRCISLNATCNEKDDCGDGSDEDINGCANADAMCENGVTECEYQCRRTPQGARCSCESGYKLSNNETCIDINECENYGICDQQCTNTLGSYTCFCQSGYSLNTDLRTCKAEGGEALMVFSLKSEIHGFFLDSEVYYPLLQNLQHAETVSLDANYVYWSDVQNGSKAIIKSLEDGSQKEVIVTIGVDSPGDIAVDWVTNNVYFTDSGFMSIGVCDNNGSHCTVIIEQTNGRPRSLALLPSSGVMYWTECGAKSRILMAGMDGKNISAIIAENLKWPSSLSIDYTNHRLYWIDSRLKIIETARLDGTDRKVVAKRIAKMPFSLAVFENKLYWSDRSAKTIQSCDKNTGEDRKTIITANNTIHGISIYHSVLKHTISNPCHSNPCSQLCLLNSYNGYTCACVSGKELDSDRHTCSADKKRMRLNIAAGNTIIDYYHGLLEKPRVMANITLNQITAVAYNPLTDGLFVSEQSSDTIFHINTNNGELQSLISFENKALGGMDFDYIGNNLYLSNVNSKTVEVHSLSTKEKTVFYFQEEPHAIALVPEEGQMFVVFHANEKYRIDLMKMHGMGPRIPVEGNKVFLLGPMVSLHYDRDLKRLFWSDQGTGLIGATTIEDMKTHILRTGLLKPVSLAILGDYVFWTQFKSDKLYWTSKTDVQQHDKRIALQIPNDLDNLRLVSSHRPDISINEHECRRDNGNCSHTCLVSNLHSYTCACPPNMMLLEDDRTCSPQFDCSPDEMKCGQYDVCIKLHQRCDGLLNCPNGEDETDVCDEFQLSKCAGFGQFRCRSGECISVTSRCNSRYECRDGSDEEDCDEKACNSSRFQQILNFNNFYGTCNNETL